jgi:hypothetical protein
MRRVIVSISLGLLIATLIGACGSWNPAWNPQSRDYPCGPRGIVCSGSYPNAVCCWQGDTCGSGAPFSTCPLGYCCNDGDEQSLTGPLRVQWAPQR